MSEEVGTAARLVDASSSALKLKLLYPVEDVADAYAPRVYPRRKLRGALPIHFAPLMIKHRYLAIEKAFELGHSTWSAGLPLEPQLVTR